MAASNPNETKREHEGARRLRVLIADDMAAVRQELSITLSLLGELEIVGMAQNGAEAIRLARTLRPDVALLDLEMPGVDGLAAASVIKGSDAGCRIVALTIHGDAATRRAAEDAGVDVFIEKGAPLATLVHALRGE